MPTAISMKSRSRVYHDTGCLYLKRIKYENRLWIDHEEAEKRGYHECNYCSGVRGFVRTKQYIIQQLKHDKGYTFTYDSKTDTLYVKTDIGFWKIFRRDGMYVLYHLNRFDPEKSPEELQRKPFHRQKDVKPAGTVKELIRSIEKHDDAMKVIAIDYRMLPKKTNRQKRYYKAAERRAQRQQDRRIDELFKVIEAQRLKAAE